MSEINQPVRIGDALRKKVVGLLTEREKTEKKKAPSNVAMNEVFAAYLKENLGIEIDLDGINEQFIRVSLLLDGDVIDTDKIRYKQ